MIPPTDGSPMEDPPPWYDKVIDLSLDEARGLFEMGVKVYWDYASSAPPPRVGWRERPFNIPVGRVSEIGAGTFYTRLYHIPKGPPNEA